MNREDRRTVSREYFSEDRLAEHHFRSFNNFLERGMQDVVTEKERIETDIGDKEGEEPVFVELGDVRIETPRVREADGSEELLFPQEARLRNITYAAPVFMEMSIVRGGDGSVEFVTLVRALGLESDEEIVHRVSDDPEIVKFMLENLEEASVQTEEEAIETLGKRVASGQGKNYQLKRANYVIDRYLLPHLHEDGIEEEAVRINKAYYLCRMAEACFELALDRRESDDKDHYANKRLKVSGDLMKDLFRTALNKLARDVKYQLERANMRNRQLTVSTVVRSDVLTERLEHPIATGNWVGGRSGVSQLVDRTDYMGVLSHLRRLRSPLSRSQPHFEARDLHATQWGRICPSETPEGPNCGLVKNFAQAMELSQNVEDEQSLKRELSSMGVDIFHTSTSTDDTDTRSPADD